MKLGQSINVRAVLPGDFKEDALHHLCALINQAYFESEADFWNKNMERTNVQQVQQILQNKAMLIAMLDDHVVGCVNVNRLSNNVAEFNMLSTAQAYRGLGVGKKLVGAAENWAIEQGCNYMQLRVLSPRGQKHAHKDFLKDWYQKLGYIFQRAERLEELYPVLAADFNGQGDFFVYQKKLVAPK